MSEKIISLVKTILICLAMFAILSQASLIFSLNGEKDNTANDILVECQHEYGESVVISEATCSEMGVKKQTCKLCNVSKTIYTPFLEHDIVIDEEVLPTCFRSGLTRGSHCSVCNTIIVEQTFVERLDHTEVEDKGYPATCTEAGLSNGYHCSVCNEVTKAQEVIEAYGHKVVEVNGKAPSCVANGYEAYEQCIRCTYNTKVVIPATGHVVTSTEWIKHETLPYWYKVCDVCGGEGLIEENPAFTVRITANGCQLPTSALQMTPNDTRSINIYANSYGENKYYVLSLGDVYGCSVQLVHTKPESGTYELLISNVTTNAQIFIFGTAQQ